MIRHNRGQSTPSSVAVVAVQGEERPAEQSEDESVERFHRCTATFSRMTKGVPDRTITSYCETADVFWLALGSQLNKSRPVHVFAHGMGRAFALLGGFEKIASGELSLSAPAKMSGNVRYDDQRKPHGRQGLAVLADNPFILETWLGGCRIVWLDICNYFDESVESLKAWTHKWSPSFGQEQEELGPNPLTVDGECQIVTRAIHRWLWLIHQYGLGRFAWTAAGQAWNAYRHGWMDQPIHVHGNPSALKLERQAYRGARSDVFRLGRVEGPLYRLDVNGLFPSVMAKNKFPSALIGHEIAPSAASVRKRMETDGAIARVRLDTVLDQYPFMDRGKLLWAEGVFTTVLAGPELQRAFAADAVVSVGEVCYYHMSDLFSRFVDFFWSLRIGAQREGDTVVAHLAKRLLVSLYGKFAQRAQRWEECPEMTGGQEWGSWTHIDASTHEQSAMRSLANRAAKKLPDGETNDSCPSIAAYVTSYARVRMDDLRKAAGHAHVFHQYIDSLIVDEVGAMNLLGPGLTTVNGIGELRFDGKAEWAEFFGAGDYVWGGIQKTCGLQIDAVPLPDGAYVVTETEGPASLAGRRPDGTVRSRIYVKALKRQPPAGHVHPDGRVDPPVIKEMQ